MKNRGTAMRTILVLIVFIVAGATSIQATAEAPVKHADCVDALEQIIVLRTPMPAYIEEDRFHRDITASERRLELARLTKVVRSSCGKDPKIRERQDIASHQLYVARSPECRFVWARYAAMMTPESGFTHEEIERQNAIMKEKCPATSLDQHWLIETTGTVNDPDLVQKLQPQ